MSLAQAGGLNEKERAMARQRPWVVLALLTTLSASLFLPTLVPGWPGLLWTSGMASLAALGIIAWGWYGPWNQLLYFWISAAFFLVGFSLNTFLLSGGWALEQVMLPMDYETISRSFRIGIVGWVCWSLGFLRQMSAARSWRDRKEAEERDGRLSLAGLQAVAIVGMGGEIVVGMFAHSLAGNLLFEQVGTVFSILGTFGMIAVCTLYEIGGKKQRFIALALLGVSVLSGMLTGQRAELFKGIIFFLLFLMYRRDVAGRSQRKLGLAIAAVLMSFVLLYPVLTQFKLAMSSGRSESSGLDRTLLLLESLPSATDEASGFSMQDAGKFLLRMSQVQFGALLLVAKDEQWGRLNGRSLYECAIMFIPRFLWHNKPVIGLGPEAYALLGYKEGTGSSIVPVAVDWYLNFEWPGVVAGMWLLGALISLVHRKLGAPGIVRNAALVTVSMEICQAGTGLKGIVFPLVFYGFGCLVLERILMRKRSQPATRSHRGEAP